MNFISNTSSCFKGEETTRKRTRQVDKSPNAPPTKVTLDISQPEVIARYYKGNGEIDKHNRDRADQLKMEKKLETKSWDV